MHQKFVSVAYFINFKNILEFYSTFNAFGYIFSVLLLLIQSPITSPKNWYKKRARSIHILSTYTSPFSFTFIFVLKIPTSTSSNFTYVRSELKRNISIFYFENLCSGSLLFVYSEVYIYFFTISCIWPHFFSISLTSLNCVLHRSRLCSSRWILKYVSPCR